MTRKPTSTRRLPLGRRPGNGLTRAEILAAARQLFAEEGYSGTTTRAIAAAAKVNVSLILHYFGSKEDLFLEAIHVPKTAYHAIWTAIDEGPAQTIGARVVRTYLSLWENPETAAPMLSVVRSAFSAPLSAHER